jgi:hypothetical protein
VRAEICAHAGVAQLVEHRFCKPKVRGSSPLPSSIARGVETPLVAGSEFRLLTPTHRQKIRRSLGRGGFLRPAASQHRVSEDVVEGGGLQHPRRGDSKQTPRSSRSERGAPSSAASAQRASRARGPWGESFGIHFQTARGAESAPLKTKILVGCPSGQREQAVNLPASAYEGSNPSPTTAVFSDSKTAGVTQLVECQPSKLNVAGSNPVSRSAQFLRNPALIAQVVERVLGKDEVTSSNLVEGSLG